MKGYARHILTVFFSLTVALNVSAREVVAVNDTLTTEDEIVARVDSLGQEVEEEAKAFNPKETIFEHLGDEYGWNIVGRVTLPLPVIVRGIDGSWHVFSSTRLEDGKEYEGFYIAREGTHEGKIVATDATGNVYRPYDFSITKNAFSIMISALITMLIAFSLVRYYRKNKYKAPRKGVGSIEMVVEMLYKEVIVSVLGKEARKYAPYLLTLFFFIFISNLMGLVAFFPGGANVMGNMSITLVLAVCTFVVVNVSGTKEYWKEIFWPDVPFALKCPVPLLPIIEIFGVFTKPIALMIRLFANMLGGHLIVLVLISLIFMFGVMGQVVVGVTTIFSVLFAVFMNLIHVLIGFIQAYVFMLLSTIFIGLARVKRLSDL
ncbi:F0F1 ATP synthase subunit A [uncultured Butyricimonas sp.]|uniref:F0F1 ATP synthase subunit A n=1 Tax=uncultured Butyricimonas sp. TaxID=1268785 RepID=UPI0026DD9457|nr:F0F1 ATP synthase subunit A [uncultured Butyricimonas sp.]